MLRRVVKIHHRKGGSKELTAVELRFEERLWHAAASGERLSSSEVTR